jgi:hypothetical protein
MGLTNDWEKRIEYFFNTVVAGLRSAKEKSDFQSNKIFDCEYRRFVQEAIIWPSNAE